MNIHVKRFIHYIRQTCLFLNKTCHVFSVMLWKLQFQWHLQCYEIWKASYTSDRKRYNESKNAMKYERNAIQVIENVLWNVVTWYGTWKQIKTFHVTEHVIMRAISSPLLPSPHSLPSLPLHHIASSHHPPPHIAYPPTPLPHLPLSTGLSA